MIRLTIAFFSLFVFLLLGGTQPGWVPEPERATLSKVCKHYENRARFKPRGAKPEFVVLLADGCTSAQLSLRSPSNAERQAAVAFLVHLQDLQDVVIDMNMTLVFGRGYTPVSKMSYGNATRSEAMPHVSAVGEFLIAHRMGLIDAYNAWLDTDPKMTFASREEHQ